MCVCKCIQLSWRYTCWGRIIRKFISKSSIIQSQCFYGELCVYGEQQFIPYTSIESQLRCLWPDGTDSMHSTRCAGFGFRTKDMVKAKDGTWVNAAKKISDYYMFGFHLNFDLETFYWCQILHDHHMRLLDSLWEMAHAWRDCGKSGLRLR